MRTGRPIIKLTPDEHNVRPPSVTSATAHAWQTGFAGVDSGSYTPGHVLLAPPDSGPLRKGDGAEADTL
jgi:hypothetical protein